MPKHRRFHQSSRDRRHESEGMRRHEERIHREATRVHRAAERERGGMQEMRDRDEYGIKRSVTMARANEYGMRHGSHGMIDENRHEFANLPQNVVYRPYGDPVGYLPQEIDDTIRGIDAQRHYDYSKAHEDWFPKKV